MLQYSLACVNRQAVYARCSYQVQRIAGSNASFTYSCEQCVVFAVYCAECEEASLILCSCEWPQEELVLQPASGAHKYGRLVCPWAVQQRRLVPRRTVSIAPNVSSSRNRGSSLSCSFLVTWGPWTNVVSTRLGVHIMRMLFTECTGGFIAESEAKFSKRKLHVTRMLC